VANLNQREDPPHFLNFANQHHFDHHHHHSTPIFIQRKSTKKNFKFQTKSSCGHTVKHMAGIILLLAHTLLLTGF
jgi:hypothetical protein